MIRAVPAFHHFKEIRHSRGGGNPESTDLLERLDFRLRGNDGKTGLKKVEFPVKRLADFDPFKEAVAFKEGVATVSVSSVPEFRLGEETFGPFMNQKVELPTAAAVLIVCKGRGEVVDYNVQ